MLQTFGNFFGARSQHPGGGVLHTPKVVSPLAGRGVAVERKPVYAKVFRWKLPEGQTQLPQTVEVIGSFTDWQAVPLVNDHKVGSWHATVPEIPGNKTHHYTLLVDGRPTPDKGCDGYALPNGPQEERYAFDTVRGPRLCMLFAQTK
jgi:hypothetical protein